jgi:hypothetical protein
MDQLVVALKSCVGKDNQLQFVQHAESMRVQQHHASLIGVDSNSASAASTMNSFVLRHSNAEKEMAEWISYLVVKNSLSAITFLPNLH